ncbi:unnamed protein product [Litomosoides sigmodontis]|uniref:Ground-like domain-containing protein n=1 Tax=Litomosoides sigmodontis TaxID=42156 RepID=A0A3P6TCC8_LITSI|nr:unnamed protein product [Litomosoides sigmodontis]
MLTEMIALLTKAVRLFLFGYICCDKQLEEMMENVMNANNNNLLNVAKRIDKNARTLRGKFETVVAFDDFAYKGLFKAGKACRVLKNGMQALT